MARQPGERRLYRCAAKFVRTDVAGLLAHVLGAPLGVQRRHLVGQDLDFLRREQSGKNR
jgi:phage terminase Nu1 subunit (DNA packaging protein)